MSSSSLSPRTASRTQYPRGYPPPLTYSCPRTSVGARPHVVEVGAAEAVAADDVDGAGDGVDHGRVVISASPRRAGRAARPRGTCGRTRAITGRSRRTQPRARPPTRGAPADARRGPSYKYLKPPPCDGRARTAPRRAQCRLLHIRAEMQSDGTARTRACAHRGTHTRAHAHARAHARKWTQTHK